MLQLSDLPRAIGVANGSICCWADPNQRPAQVGGWPNLTGNFRPTSAETAQITRNDSVESYGELTHGQETESRIERKQSQLEAD